MKILRIAALLALCFGLLLSASAAAVDYLHSPPAEVVHHVEMQQAHDAIAHVELAAINSPEIATVQNLSTVSLLNTHAARMQIETHLVTLSGQASTVRIADPDERIAVGGEVMTIKEYMERRDALLRVLREITARALKRELPTLRKDENGPNRRLNSWRL